MRASTGVQECEARRASFRRLTGDEERRLSACVPFSKGTESLLRRGSHERETGIGVVTVPEEASRRLESPGARTQCTLRILRGSAKRRRRRGGQEHHGRPVLLASMCLAADTRRFDHEMSIRAGNAEAADGADEPVAGPGGDGRRNAPTQALEAEIRIRTP